METLADKHQPWIDLCKTTAQDFGTPSDKLSYLKAKLWAETGEFIGDLLGWLFHNNKVKRDKLIEEAGDVFWYCFNIASENGLTDCLFLENDFAVTPTFAHESIKVIVENVADIILIDLAPNALCESLSAVLSEIMFLCKMVHHLTSESILNEIESVNMKKIWERSGRTGIYNKELFNIVLR